ncbi:alpha/beta hydrolase family protein [Streptomyces zaomyceticus]|uniref:hypothetical protein n=1 Tax=Streptomyces zaomyceticus TaxID=68286 RepID=UPI0036CC9FE8
MNVREETLLVVPGLGRDRLPLTIADCYGALREVTVLPKPMTSPGFHHHAAHLKRFAGCHGAKKVIAESFGASTVLHALSTPSHPFTHAVLIAPFCFDQPRQDIAEHLSTLLEAANAGGSEAISEFLLDTLNLTDRRRASARPWADETAEGLLRPGVSEVLAWLPFHCGVPSGHLDPTVRLLVIAQPGDHVHSLDVARRIAAASPRARLEIMPEPGGILLRTGALTGLISDFLAS